MAENTELQALKNTQSIKNLSDVTAVNHKERLAVMAANHKEQLELTATSNKEQLALSSTNHKEQLAVDKADNKERSKTEKEKSQQVLKLAKETAVQSENANDYQAELGIQRKEAIDKLGEALKSNGVIAEKTEKEIIAGNKEAEASSKKQAPIFKIEELQLSLLDEILFNIHANLVNAKEYRIEEKEWRAKQAAKKKKELKENRKFRLTDALKNIEDKKDKLKALPKKGFTKAIDGIKSGVTSLWGALKKVLKGALLIGLMVALGKFLESDTFKKLLASLESGEFFDNLMTWWDDTKERVTGFVDKLKSFGKIILLVIGALLAFKLLKLGKALMGLVGLGKGAAKVAAKTGTKVVAKTAGQVAIKGVAKTGIMTAAQKTAQKAAAAAAAKKAATTVGVKTAGKGLVKAGLKKIPVLGALFGAGFAISRLMKGDKVGAGMELASGLASIIPGFGTAASVGIDAALIARDMNKAKPDTDTLTKPVEDTSKKLTDSQREIDQADRANGSTVIVNAPANSNTTTNTNNNNIASDMPEANPSNNFDEPTIAA